MEGLARSLAAEWAPKIRVNAVALGAILPPPGKDSAYLKALAKEIPLQRVPERNSYRRALITYDQAVRGLELTLENVERDIRNSLRELDRLEQSIELQGAQITQDERAVEVTRIRYESGEADNRDLLDARQSLTNAQDALIQARVDHFIARLQLYRDLGLLFVDEKGRWRT